VKSFPEARVEGTVRIGLLDSGGRAALAGRVLARAHFELGRDGQLTESYPIVGRDGHGNALAGIIAALAPETRFLDAQVFDRRGVSSPAVVAAGLDWLVRNDARVVNMSFGLIEDREVLRLACRRAREAGVVMFAATPARGQRVFPAAYPGIIRVCADGRCGYRELSVLEGGAADFGACPFPLAQYAYGRVSGGASYAVAHATGIAAAWLVERPDANATEIRCYLSSIARYFTVARTGVDADQQALARR